VQATNQTNNITTLKTNLQNGFIKISILSILSIIYILFAFPVDTFACSGRARTSLEINAQYNSCAIFYDDGGGCGQFYIISPNAKIPYVGDSYNDRFSAARVFSGYRVRAFEHENYQGKELILSKNLYSPIGRAAFIAESNGVMLFTYFPSEMYNKISSIICERD